jgi:hypothetical protein
MRWHFDGRQVENLRNSRQKCLRYAGARPVGVLKEVKLTIGKGAGVVLETPFAFTGKPNRQRQE